MPTILTNVGIVRMINALNVATGHVPPQHIGWGTGATAPAAGNTTLETAAAEARVEGTKSVQETNIANDTYQVTATLTSLSAQTIAEAALFDAVTGGNMYVRGTFTGIVLAIDDAIAFTIQIVQERAA